MSRVKALRAAIQDFLKSVHPRVHYHRADPNGAYPRLVFDLPTSFDDGNFEIFQLEVDGWDNNPDTSALEDLMAAVDGDGDLDNPTGLNKRTIDADNLTAQVYREQRLSVPDDDPRIRHRQYTYQVRVFKG